MKARVLVIDGYQGFRETMEYCLSRTGLGVVSAASLERAVALVREQGIDVVLLDATQSFATGLAECRAMKSRPEFAHVAIALLVVRVTPLRLEQAREAGATTVLPKLFDWEELMGWVERAAAERRTREGSGQ